MWYLMWRLQIGLYLSSENNDKTIEENTNNQIYAVGGYKEENHQHKDQPITITQSLVHALVQKNFW